MKNMNRLLKLTVVLCLTGISTTTYATSVGKMWTAESPDKKTQIEVSTQNHSMLTWRIEHNGVSVLDDSRINILIDGIFDVFTKGGSGKVTNRQQVRTKFATPFYKKAEVKDEYNAMTISFKNGISIEFRVYDDGGVHVC